MNLKKKMFSFKREAMLFLFFACSMGAMAQAIAVSGKVQDPGGEALAGVSVSVAGSQTGTVTDLDGAYSLNVPGSESVLKFSYIGYVSQNIKVGNQRAINVTMEEDLTNLDEIVVVGYGVQKKNDVTGALARVGEKEMKAMPVANALQGMQGKVAGVDITSNERPGELGSIRIRGERSIEATNSPLYVVDGIPLVGGIETLNPSDIEAIDVLKDASATAIYGSKGANGVVIVSTKKGKSGRLSLNYASTFTVENLNDRMTMMNSQEWIDFSRAAKIKAGTYNKSTEINMANDKAVYGNDPYAWAQFEKGWANGTWDGSLVPTYDWTSHGKQTALSQEHTLSASGGTENLQAYLSLGYLDNEGTQPGQAYKRYTVNTSVDLQATKWFKLGGNINVSYGDQDYGYDFRKSTTGADYIYGALQGMLPWTVPYTPENEYIRNPGADVNIINPIREVDLCVNQRQNLRALGSFYGEINLGNIFNVLDGLRFRVNFGPDFNYGRHGIADAKASINGDGNSVAEYNTSIRQSWVLDELLYYNKTIGKHDLGLTALHSASANHNESSNTKSFVKTDTELWWNIKSLAKIQSYGTDMSYNTLESYMLRLNYGFDNKYLLTVSGRRDGAMQLAEGHRLDFFPSAAVAWRIEQEDFMKNAEWINALKLRLGYGVTGNSAIKSYGTLGTLTDVYYHFGDSTLPGTIPSDPMAKEPVPMANKMLGWEQTAQFNLGLDFSFLKGRISGAIDLYQSETTDLLLQQRIPSTTGFTKTWANVGNTANKGVDIQLNTVNVQTRDFTWSTSLTFNADRNRITQLSNGVDRMQDSNGNWLIVGEPIGIYYDFVYDGIWKTAETEEAKAYGREPGMIKIKDLSGPDGVVDGVINENYDRKVVGKRLPDWSAGMLNTLNYKNWELSFFLYGRFGFTVNTGAETLSGRFAMRKIDYWVKDTNENALYYAPGVGGENGDTYKNSMNYQDGSFIKLRNVSLGYNFTSKQLNPIGINNLKLYVQCMNPGLLYSKIDWIDPDLGGSTYNRGFVFGLNVGF
ncbi:MAG: TonB-dependent receptor [Dysgonamonadaceae bacterium]|jgi:TonB-linked SusC/RagA family outer membrane protein|nr:TonB-dependent receptor [Dysgonamonadaceae bacterium]